MNTRRSLLEERLTWLARTRQKLSRDARRVPWLYLGVLAALPIGACFGAGAAAFTVFTTGFMATVTTYVVWAHRQEYDAEFEAVSWQIAELEDGHVRVPVRWRTSGKLLSL